MTHYLFDTNHAGAILRNDRLVRGHVASLQDAELAICHPSAGELWFMVYNSARPTENRARLITLLSQFQLVPFGMAEAEEFGRLRAELRRLGRPIPQIDLQIAAVARVGDFVLATADGHFRQVPGLQIEDWTKPPKSTAEHEDSIDRE